MGLVRHEWQRLGMDVDKGMSIGDRNIKLLGGCWIDEALYSLIACGDFDKATTQVEIIGFRLLRSRSPVQRIAEVCDGK